MRNPVSRQLLATWMLLVLSMMAFPSWGHAFGVRYDLPLPLGLYLFGAGAAVALSFAIIALFFRVHGLSDTEVRFKLSKIPVLRWLGHKQILALIRLLSVLLFGFILLACFAGDPRPFHNIAPTFVWVIWWVGTAFVSALCGDLWALVNPWATLFSWAQYISGRLRPRFAYPDWLGHWPALFLFLCFAWLELVSDAGEKPRILGGLILIYSAVTWLGMACYGREIWLRYAEVFSVVFGLLARFAPSVAEAGQLALRFPAVGLLTRRPMPVSTICLVLLLLTTVTFDGILETPPWVDMLDWIAENQALRPFVDCLAGTRCRLDHSDQISGVVSAALHIHCSVPVQCLVDCLVWRWWRGRG